QRVRVSRVTGLRALADRQPQVLEENLRELLRRVQVELLPRDIFDFLLDRSELRTKLVLHLLEVGHVDGDALTLHIGEHAGERQLPRTGAEQIGGEKRAECPVTLATAE